MSSISTAISNARKSRVTGYKIKKGFFSNETPNLNQIIAVFGQMNTANEASVDDTRKEITSAQEAGEVYGFGSPIHQAMRILRPITGEGVGGIPTIVFPQMADVAAVAAAREWTVSGAATGSATHYVVINGRRTIDFQNYSYTIASGDTASDIAAKIATAVNAVLSSPVTAVAVGAVLTFTAKYKGAVSEELTIKFDNQNVNAGVSYASTDSVVGAGAVTLAGAFAQFTEEEWITSVVSAYGSDSTILASFEAFNGKPDDETPTGRYAPRVFKPFMAFFGSVEDDKDNLILITDAAARIDQVTNVLCPAPNSEGFSVEAAANVCSLFSRIAQDTPELDVNAKSYPDMPVPDDGIIGDMSNYDNRDTLVKKGCSTVSLENGAYKIQDLITTYHPTGETPLQYSYTRNLNLDWNIKDGYDILESRNVRDHVLVEDAQVTDAAKSVKPKQWKGVLYDYFDDLGVRALIKDVEFSKNSLIVEIDGINPDRFNTFFRYRRTGVARIQSTDAEAGY